MDKIRYLGAGICVLIALSQTVPIYHIASALMQGQEELDASYYIGKLVGHLFVTVLVILLASKLIKSVIKQKDDH